MKTAYELALERLNRESPAARLTPQQKEALADLESRYKAKVAEREIVLQGEMEAARAAGDAEKLQALEQRLAADRRALQTQLEEKKDQVRRG